MRKSLLQGALAVALGGTAVAPAFGQTEPIKFGKIEAADFNTKDLAVDTTASAVVLCDYGHSYFTIGSKGDFVVMFERITRIKILKKSGYDWATVQVPLYHSGSEEEKLLNVKGATYNLDAKGQVVKQKMESDAKFTEQASANQTLRKFTLPGVREGSIIEYAYSVSSDFWFNFQDWQFQYDIPVRWSEYRADIPEYFDFKQLAQGFEPFKVNERTSGTTQFTIRWAGSFTEGGGGLNGGPVREAPGATTISAQVTNHRWAMENVPALRPEPFMTTPRDYVSRLDFELAGIRMPQQAYQNVSNTWEKIQGQLLSDDQFGGQLKRGSFLKNEIAAIVAQYPKPAERAAAVHALVRKNVKSNGNISLWTSAPLRRTWEQHTGNSADINLLLVALLREAGLKANPVILSTRQHGRVNQYFPLVSRFNYVVGHVQLPDSQQVFVDGTEEHAPFGMLPERCLNGQGRLIRADNDGQWVNLASPHRYVHFRNAQLTLDERGNLTGKVHEEHDGYQAVHQRSTLREQGEKKYMERLLKEQQNWQIDKYAFQNTDVLTKPLGLDVEMRVPSEAEQPVGTLYLRPLQFLSLSANPFTRPGRNFPVDFGARWEETNMVTLTLPENYNVEELPKNVNMTLPDNAGRFIFSITPVGNTLQVMSRMTMNRALFAAEEYENLREFYARMLAKQAEQIVLKRKS